MHYLRRVSILALVGTLMWPLTSGLAGVLSLARYSARVLAQGVTPRLTRQYDPNYQQQEPFVAAKCVLPDDAIVVVPAAGDNLILANYFLYPLKIAYPLSLTEAGTAWTHVIDLTGHLAVPAGLHRKDLTANTSVYAKPTSGYKAESCEVFEDVTRRHALWNFCLWVALSLVSGILALTYLRVAAAETGAAWFVSTALGAGLVLLVFPFWPLYLLGLKLRRESILAVASCVVVAVAVPVLWTRFTQLRENLRCIVLGPCGIRVFALVARYCALILVVSVSIGAALPTVLIPAGGWDPYTNWLRIAKMLADNQYLQNGLGAYSYPILWNLMHAVQFGLNGNLVFDEFAQWYLLVFIVLIGLQVYGVIRVLGGGAWLALWGACAYFALFVDSSFREPYADLPLAFFVITALGALTAYLRGSKTAGLYWIGLLMMCAAAGTKLEGGVTSLIIGAAFAVAASDRLRWKTRTWQGLLLCAPILINVGWIWYLTAHGWITQVGQVKEALEGGATGIVQKAAATLGMDRSAWLALSLSMKCTAVAALAIAGLSIGGQWRRSHAFAALTLASLAVFTFLVSMMGWPSGSVSGWYYQVVPRLFAHIAPIVVVVAVACLDLAWRTRSRRTADAA